MKKTGWFVPVLIGTLALIGCEDPSHEALLQQNKDSISKLEAAKKENEDKISGLETSVKNLKSKYVNPMQFDAKNIAGIAVVQKAGGAAGNLKAARFAQEKDSGIDLVVIKENGVAEPAIAIGTEENSTLTEAATSGENSNVEPEYVYVYVTEHQEAKVMKTVQCTYELNDKEAGGYYIVFNGKSTFTYSDGTKKETGSLIYVTPEGDERDIFVSAGVDVNTKIDYGKVAYDGGSLISFDENGNAFFITDNKKLYRYQPVANKLDDLTPSDVGSGIDKYCVSLDGKYVVFSCDENDKKTVKTVKIADKSVKTIYTSQIHAHCSAVRCIVYLDKSHSFYFPTSSYVWDCTEGHEHGVDNAIYRWNYETGKLDTVKYTSDSQYYNSALPGNKDPTEGETELIVTSDGIYAMLANESEYDANGNWKAWKNTVLVKLFDENGNFIKCEIPSSLKERTFAAPGAWQDKSSIKAEDPATWYRPAFLSNGKGIAVVGNKQDTIYYYTGNQLKDLLAFDTDILSDIKMSLSDKSIIFDAKRKGNTFTKSINLENGEVTTLSINGTVLNILAVKGATIKEGDASGVNLQLSIKISEQNDLKVENKTAGTQLVLEAAEGYSDYTWSCNGYVLETERRTLTKDGVDKWEKGFYPIYVTAKKDGFIYSSFIEVEVK